MILEDVFWSEFLASTIATIIGLLVGIPIALWINRNQQRLEEEAEQRIKKVEALDREKDILQLIHHELKYNRDVLRNNANDDETANKPIFETVYQLKDELWRAISNGGELRWIRDLDLLDAIAHAYYGIGMVKFTGNFYISSKSQTKPRADQKDNLVYQEELQELLCQFTTSTEYAVSYIDGAIEMLRETAENA